MPISSRSRAAMLAVAFHMDAEEVKLLMDLFRGSGGPDGALTSWLTRPGVTGVREDFGPMK